MVFFAWIRPNFKKDIRQRGRDMIAYSLKNEIGFTNSQMEQYERLRQTHRDKVKPLFEDMRKTKEQFYKLLDHPSQDSVVMRTAELIGEKQKVIDLQIFHHFQELRKLCSEDQQSKFDSLIHRVVNRMVIPFHKHNGQKKDSTR